MEVLIEKYKGYEIRFNTESEKFVTDTGNEGKEKPSYASAKKQIDEYVKVNGAFSPFKVIKKSYDGEYEKEIEITGLRKDGFSIIENGRVCKISDYVVRDCVVCSVEDAGIAQELAAIHVYEDEISEINKRIDPIKRSIKNKLSTFQKLGDKFKEYQQ